MNSKKQFKAEYAKSDRSKCRSCEDPIQKYDLRLVAVIKATTYDKDQDENYHPKCFFEIFEPESEFAFDGFSKLRNEDKEELRKFLGEGKKLSKRKHQDESSSSGIDRVDCSMRPIKKLRSDSDQELDMLIYNQDEEIHKLRDDITKIESSKTFQKHILELNKQVVPNGELDRLDHVTDVIYFGALLPCVHCKGNFLFDGNSAYCCTGNRSAYAKCYTKTTKPERKPVEVPEIYREQYPFLRVGLQVKQRLVRSHEPCITSSCDEFYAEKAKEFRDWHVNGLPQCLKEGVIVEFFPKNVHIYGENGQKFSAILTKVDHFEGTNSYYKLQLIESDTEDHREYWIYRSWGRISTKIGDNQTDEFDDPHSAIRKFKKLFREKTGNDFTAPEFQKRPGKYNLFSNSEDDIRTIYRSTMSETLMEPVQKLLKILMDERIIMDVMGTFNLDVSKTPLAIVSEEKIRQALAILNEIKMKLRTNGSPEVLIEASNRFHSCIPYNVTADDIINSKMKLKEKYDLLKSISEIKFTLDFLNKNTFAKERNFLDAVYTYLNVQIEPLDPESKKYEAIQTMVQESKMDLNIKIKYVLEIRRKSDEVHFEPYKDWPNRRLLWHGSRLTSYMSILWNGLKIMPENQNGSTFGNGIYFADVFANAAQYCYANQTGNIGLLSLSEVALGNEFLCNEPFWNENLPDGHHSLRAPGKMSSDHSENSILLDGAIIPKGVPTTHDGIVTNLDYNEFVVFNEAQVKIKYLVWTKFEPTAFKCSL